MIKGFDKPEFAKRFKAFMKNRDLTQKIVQTDTQIDQATISKFSSAKTDNYITVDQLCTICNAYSISADYLLGLDNTDEKEEQEEQAIESLGEIEKLMVKLTESECGFDISNSDGDIIIHNEELKSFLKTYSKLRNLCMQGEITKKDFDTWESGRFARDNECKREYKYKPKDIYGFDLLEKLKAIFDQQYLNGYCGEWNNSDQDLFTEKIRKTYSNNDIQIMSELLDCFTNDEMYVSVFRSAFDKIMGDQKE